MDVMYYCRSIHSIRLHQLWSALPIIESQLYTLKPIVLLHNERHLPQRHLHPPTTHIRPILLCSRILGVSTWITEEQRLPLPGPLYANTHRGRMLRAHDNQQPISKSLHRSRNL